MQRGRFARFADQAAGVGPALVGRLDAVDGAHPDDSVGTARWRCRGPWRMPAAARWWVLSGPHQPVLDSSRPFRPGAAAVAIRGQVPLVPVVVWGGQRVLTVGGRFSLRRGRAVTVLAAGAPLRPPVDADPYAVTAALREATDRLLSEAMDAHPDRPVDATDTWWLPASRGGSAPTAEGALMDEAALAPGEWVSARRTRRPAGSSHRHAA